MAGMFQDPAHWNAPCPASRRNSAPPGLSTTSAIAWITRVCSAVRPAAPAPDKVSMQASHCRW